MPKRIQLRRMKKGWRMPPNTVHVAWPSKWSNPFKVGIDGDAGACVRLYAEWLTPYQKQGPKSTTENLLLSEANIKAIEADLAGKDLACWCPIGQPCHADVLLEIANGR
jgi:hypothetical protein